jgi:antitoxin component YwqK of YwqJK toxin-antitoxin module
METDTDTDGVLETTAFYEHEKIIRQTRDENADFRADITIYFDANEQKERVESDADFDGRMDTWEFYKDGVLEHQEKDENADGRVDLRMFFEKGERVRLIRDADFDGRFEITQFFNHPEWSMVMEIDTWGDDAADGRFCYRDGTLRQKELDENNDGKMDFIEFFNASGKLERLAETYGGSDHPSLVWYYDEGENPVRAEHDADADGRPEVWFYYAAGRVTEVAEDTNADGRPDFWEFYDAAEAVIRVEKDYDFDGTVDVVEDLGEKPDSGEMMLNTDSSVKTGI